MNVLGSSFRLALQSELFLLNKILLGFSERRKDRKTERQRQICKVNVNTVSCEISRPSSANWFINRNADVLVLMCFIQLNILSE